MRVSDNFDVLVILFCNSPKLTDGIKKNERLRHKNWNAFFSALNSLHSDIEPGTLGADTVSN